MTSHDIPWHHLGFPGSDLPSRMDLLQHSQGTVVAVDAEHSVAGIDRAVLSSCDLATTRKNHGREREKPSILWDIIVIYSDESWLVVII